MSAKRPPKLRRQLGHRLKNGRRSGTRWFVELNGRRIHLGSGGDGDKPVPRKNSVHLVNTEFTNRLILRPDRAE